MSRCPGGLAVLARFSEMNSKAPSMVYLENVSKRFVKKCLKTPTSKFIIIGRRKAREISKWCRNCSYLSFHLALDTKKGMKGMLF